MVYLAPPNRLLFNGLSVTICLVTIPYRCTSRVVTQDYPWIDSGTNVLSRSRDKEYVDFPLSAKMAHMLNLSVLLSIVK